MADDLHDVMLGPLTPAQRALIDTWASYAMNMTANSVTHEDARAIRHLIANARPMGPSPADEMGVPNREKLRGSSA